VAALKLHFKFFDKPYCQRDNWRGRAQHFPYAKPDEAVTCKACAKYSQIGAAREKGGKET